MIANYFKIAWRNLLNNSFYSLLNCLGLSIGLAVGILILLWVRDELSFDRFNTKSGSIYKLENRVGTGASQQIWTNTVAPIAGFAKREVPEVKDAVRMTYNGAYTLFRYKDKVFNEENTFFADPTLFTMFDYKLIHGNRNKPFLDNHSVVLTETTARRYFGSTDAIGKAIIAEKATFTVSGVVADFPENSSVKGDMIFPIALRFKDVYEGRKDGKTMDNDFTEFDYTTYFLLQPGRPVTAIATTLRNIHLRNKPDDTDLTYLLQALPDVHLYKSDGVEQGIETVRMFSVIALLILIIACINYVNLSTARSLLRSKEVSMRKIVGAARMQLFVQFLVETVLLFSIATLLAVVFMYVLMPFFNQISGKKLVLDFAKPHIWQVLGATIAGTLIASSIYPALLLSSFEPLKSLKGKVSAGLNEAMFRKTLVVIQFTVSVILIAGTLIISNQLKYIRSKGLGYDKTHVLSFYMRDLPKHYDVIKSELLNQPGITDVSRSNFNVVLIGGQTGTSNWDGKEPGETMMIQFMSTDKSFIPFFKMQLKEGTNFTDAPSDSKHYILNETAVKTARITNPIGKRFKLWDTEGTIIGVVKDFHFASMKEKIKPAVLVYNPNDMSRIYIKTTGNDAKKAIAAAEDVWKKFNADSPFQYAFLDEAFNSLYRSEEQTGLLFNIFASIAILISCLGLFGLATYTAQIRKKEIGVRKVLGSSLAGIVQLLAKDFVKLVFIGIIIAVPIAWYTMDKWLQDFAYRMEMPWWVFGFAGLLALAIALLTISFQSIKAALMDPVKSLRSE
ncbi:ABC transporter permease [Dyadobacter sp. LJ53]|uniref:ABC transporter permease n=1 Tax=Dyadobacter chenwenxiniae TaxID=2906456 RepID=UPI001F3C107F|nr:ABC transporter permease [Dyadobacter chenwenxiniae]MCF0053582.1 ABC transporter permease [Dyadobacter chenwenxiniae]